MGNRHHHPTTEIHKIKKEKLKKIKKIKNLKEISTDLGETQILMKEILEIMKESRDIKNILENSTRGTSHITREKGAKNVAGTTIFTKIASTDTKITTN